MWGGHACAALGTRRTANDGSLGEEGSGPGSDGSSPKKSCILLRAETSFAEEHAVDAHLEDRHSHTFKDQRRIAGMLVPLLVALLALNRRVS